MNRVLQFCKSKSMPVIIAGMVYGMFYAYSHKAHAFNNNNGRNLPFCDTLVVPSWDPPGFWYTFAEHRWFVYDETQRLPGKASRTFYRKKSAQEQMAQSCKAALARQVEEFKRLKALKSVHRTAALEVTYDDLKKAYALGSDYLEYQAFPKNVTMDMKDFDPNLEKPQHWVMPKGLQFDQITRKIVDPKSTPYSKVAPHATHCLYVKTPNAGINLYNYFLLDEEGLFSVGEAMDKHKYTDDTEEEVFPLPLDVNTCYYSGYGETEDWTVDGDTTWYDDNEYGVDIWYYISEAFGTLETEKDGTIDVIKIAYQWWWLDYEVDPKSTTGEDKLLDYANGTEIYFYGKNGTQLMISIDSLDVETTGIVKPDMIYYQKVQKSGTSVEDNASMKAPKTAVSFYPNPTRGLIRFSAPTSLEIYDVLGRSVVRMENATQADLSGLPRGMYFLKPQQGKVQKLILQR
jgi:hypothetical protein